MNARELREAGKLWPQTLSNVELKRNINECDPSANPITWRMLWDEWKRRDRP